MPVFLLTSIILCITPGPSVVYTMAFTLRYGMLVGFVSAIGVNIGSYVSILIAAFGSSLLFSNYSQLFVFVKILGAIYIFSLATKMWPKPHMQNHSADGTMEELEDSVSKFTVFKNGVITSLLNPKDIVFYVSFVPNFIKIVEINVTYTVKFLILSFTYAFIGLVTKSVFIVSSGWLKNYAEHKGAAYLNYIASLSLALLSVFFLASAFNEWVKT